MLNEKEYFSISEAAKFLNCTYHNFYMVYLSKCSPIKIVNKTMVSKQSVEILKYYRDRFKKKLNKRDKTQK